MGGWGWKREPKFLGAQWADCTRDEWTPGSTEAKDASTGQTLSLPVVPPAAAGIPAPLASPKKDAVCLGMWEPGVGITIKAEREEEDLTDFTASGDAVWNCLPSPLAGKILIEIAGRGINILQHVAVYQEQYALGTIRQNSTVLQDVLGFVFIVTFLLSARHCTAVVHDLI